MVDITTHELDPADAPSPKDVVPSIAWLVVEPRHYQEAQRLKKDEGIEAYREYIVSLVFSLDRQSVRQPHTLSKKTVGQIVAAFEERFSDKG